MDIYGLNMMCNTTNQKKWHTMNNKLLILIKTLRGVLMIYVSWAAESFFLFLGSICLLSDSRIFYFPISMSLISV